MLCSLTSLVELEGPLGGVNANRDWPNLEERHSQGVLIAFGNFLVATALGSCSGRIVATDLRLQGARQIGKKKDLFTISFFMVRFLMKVFRVTVGYTLDCLPANHMTHTDKQIIQIPINTYGQSWTILNGLLGEKSPS